MINYKTAIFRQINQDNPRANHDALESPNGELVLLTFLAQGQQVTVLQLPAAALGAKARNERPTFNPLSVAPAEKASILRPIEALPLVSALKPVQPEPREPPFGRRRIPRSGLQIAKTGIVRERSRIMSIVGELVIT